MKPERNLSVDALRFVAAFGVIIIHLAPSTDAAAALTRMFGLFAVPFFLSVSLHFFIHRVRALPTVKLSDLRLDRLLVPYVTWTLVYTALRVLKFRLEGKPPGIDVIGVTFFGGAALHLYFLPLLLLLQALALAALFLVRTSRYRLAGIGIGLGAVGFGYAAATGSFFGFQGVLARGFLFVALAFLLDRTQASTVGRRINFLLGWLTVGCLVTSPTFGYPLYLLGSVWQGPVVGYSICGLALNGRVPIAHPALRTLLTCSYGIYLAHFAFLETLETAAKKLPYVLAPYSVGAKLVMSSLICLGCIVFVLLARLRRLTAYLFLGEATVPAGRSSRPPRDDGAHQRR